MNQHKQDLLEIYYAALKSVAGKAVVSKEFKSYDYPESFHVVAIGKAADAMLQGVFEVETANSLRVKSALLISKHGHISEAMRQDTRVTCIESDHPVPKENSIKAGVFLLDFIGTLPLNEPCIFLISGGASALVEVLYEGWNLSQLQELTDYLLANAYPINEINVVRQRISKIKGGGLWSYLGERPVYCLMISDVPNDDPRIIGSGLLFPVEELQLPDLPEQWLEKINPFIACKQGNNFTWKTIASLGVAKKAAKQKAIALGYATKVILKLMQGNATDVAASCVKRIEKNPNTLFVWGGETTVHLPEGAGMGGRNQHLALAAAIHMQGLKNTYLLAAGTDGSDGLTSATGALVDNQTVNMSDKNASDYLTRADSNTFFKNTECLIETGATGTNVMDLVIAISTD
ncbi:MAG: DUF4147 domain-containing protein [Cocleimonas sp.]